MSDWDLMIPGIGLTIIGMAGVGLSLAGISKTFLEGMHAISALVMFVGMIFLAAGLLKGGLPTTSASKAAAAIILGLMIAFGAFAAAASTVSTLSLFIGILLMVIAPSIVIAYALSRNSKHTKAISILFISASAVGMISFLAFNVATQPIEAGEEVPEESAEETPEGPRVEIIIAKDAAIQGNIPYLPQEINVKQGVVLVWINNDTIAHTVTSGSGFDDSDFGKLFDSSLINQGEEYALDTSKLELGTYQYFCTLHPFMIGSFTIEPAVESEATIPEESVIVEVVNGAGQQGHQEPYKPQLVIVKEGDTITWINKDVVPHTVTGASNPLDANTWGDVTIGGEKFDSAAFLPDEGMEFSI